MYQNKTELLISREITVQKATPANLYNVQGKKTTVNQLK